MRDQRSTKKKRSCNEKSMKKWNSTEHELIGGCFSYHMWASHGLSAEPIPASRHRASPLLLTLGDLITCAWVRQDFTPRRRRNTFLAQHTSALTCLACSQNVKHGCSRQPLGLLYFEIWFPEKYAWCSGGDRIYKTLCQIFSIITSSDNCQMPTDQQGEQQTQLALLGTLWNFCMSLSYWK